MQLIACILVVIMSFTLAGYNPYLMTLDCFLLVIYQLSKDVSRCLWRTDCYVHMSLNWNTDLVFGFDVYNIGRSFALLLCVSLYSNYSFWYNINLFNLYMRITPYGPSTDWMACIKTWWVRKLTNLSIYNANRFMRSPLSRWSDFANKKSTVEHLLI